MQYTNDWDIEFRWDEGNLEHAGKHGVTPRLVLEVARRQPHVFDDDGQGHSGSHVMIGPNARGRFWTIILLEVTDTIWRPITGWRSTRTERDLYREAQ